jgi:ribosomal protein S18 acetylase RimI-like enzyme
VAAGAAIPELVEAIERHQTELSVRWTRVQEGVVAETDGFVLTINPGVKVAFANNVHRIRLEPDEVADAARECTAAFRGHGVPALWWVSQLATPQEPGRELEARGWKYDEAMPWMAARMDRVEWPETPPGLRIERVIDERVHARFVQAMTAGFGMRAAEQHALNSLAAAVGYVPDAPWVRWVGSLESRVVASSGLMLGGGVAGIYNVATAPDARRRGIGAALTAAAVAEGRERGFEVAVLGASELGYGVYARMGFREVCRDRVWMLPERSKGTT